MPKKKKNPFSGLQSAATGYVGLGVTTAIGAGVQAKAPAGTPSLTQGFSTLASFTPVISTAVGGKSALNAIKGLKKKK